MLLLEVATSEMAWWRVLRREACKKIVRCSGEGFVRGTMLTPWEQRRATLVERVIELPSLVGRFLQCPRCGLGG